MAKLKLLKMPKKPRLPKKPAASASLATKENYLRRVADLKKAYDSKCREVKSENLKRTNEQKKSEALSKRIAGIKGFDSLSSRSTAVRRKKSAPKKAAKKAVKKATKKRRR